MATTRLAVAVAIDQNSPRSSVETFHSSILKKFSTLMWLQPANLINIFALNACVLDAVVLQIPLERALYQPEKNAAFLWGINRITTFSQYVGVITIGSSRQVIRVLFDTDSLYTWIPTQPSIYYSHFYKSELSATSHPLNRSFVSLFEDTMISGRLIKDILHLTPDVYIRSQTIGQVDQVPLADGVIPYDGVVGFGFDVLELGDAQTPMHALKQSNLLDENVFAFCLGPNGGELRIGEFDPTCYKPPIVFVPVYLSKQWSVRLTGIYVNDKLVVRDAYAYFASGENYISGPDDQVEKLAEQVGAYKFPFTDFYWLRCSKKVNLSFEIGGQLFTFTPDDYIRKVGPICIFMFRHISKMTGQDAWLFGDIFLRKVYTIFKYGNRNESEIGFALAT